MNRKYFFIIILISVNKFCVAQPTAGTTGLLNTPSAEMQTDGTFMFGGNFLPEQITPHPFSYNTGNYYINITFLPFCEVNYRCTFLQTNNTGQINQQDRSFALRLRLLNEKKYTPSFVLGGNDIYTSSGGKGNQYFGATYAVATKHFKTNCLTITCPATDGYRPRWAIV